MARYCAPSVRLVEVMIHRLEPFRRHLRRDLLEGNRREVPAVDADVERLARLQVFERAVAVAVEVPRAVVHLVPGPEGVMAEVDLLLADLEPEVILDPNEPADAELVLGDLLVVPSDEEDLPVQTRAIAAASSGRPRAKSPR